MRMNYFLLGLITLSAVIAIYMMGNPEQAERFAQMRRDIGFQGEAREVALTVLALGIGAFIAYLAISRR